MCPLSLGRLCVLSQTPLKCVVRPDREGNCTLSCVDIVEGQVEGKTFQIFLTRSFHLEFWAVSFILSSHPPDKDL